MLPFLPKHLKRHYLWQHCVFHFFPLNEAVSSKFVDSFPFWLKVWASGFSAAILKKQSVATKASIRPVEGGVEIVVDANTLALEHKPAVTETALLAILEKFFEVVLNLPSVNK